MKITDYETKNSVAIFALQGKCFRKLGGSIVSSAAFLTGMAAVVLGLMFTLSTPSFAQNAGTGSEDIEIINRNPIRTSSTGTGIDADHSGSGDIDITNKSTIDVNQIGIDADHDGTGDIDITNENTVKGDSKGIKANHTGTGNIDITNEDEDIIQGSDAETDDTSIDADHSGSGDIEITNKGTVEKSRIGIQADHTSAGNIVITNEGTASGEWDGIKANHTGTGDIGIANEGTVYRISVSHTGTGDSGIVNEGTIQGEGSAISAGHTGTGDLEITNKNFVWGELFNGTDAIHGGTGDIRITNEGTARGGLSGIKGAHGGTGDLVIINKGFSLGESSAGIYTQHSGTGDTVITNEGTARGDGAGISASQSVTGDMRITNKNFIQGKNGNGIHAVHYDTGDIGIINERNVQGGWHGILASAGAYEDDGNIEIINKSFVQAETNHGIHAILGFRARNGGGVGDIGIVNEGTVEAGDTGIYAKHGGTGDIGITNKLLVDADDTGINAEHSGTGDIVVKVDDGSTVIADSGYGIKSSHIDDGTGEITIDLSGTVLGNDDDGAISMTSSGDKTLILRPGYGLDVGQEDDVNITSAGTGDGILELNQDDDPLEGGATHASATLDFGTLDFQGFDEFAKKGQNKWEISGVASDTEKFDTATIWEGTLGFTGGTTFKMAPAATGADPNYFKIENNAVLEVVGSNTLSGNLYNLGEIVFTYDRDVEENPASVLTVGTDYRGGGKVIFDVGSGSWQADKISIGRNNVNPTEATKVRILGEVSNFVSANNEYLPMVVEVTGTANPGSFVADESSGHDVNHHKYVFGHHPDTDAQGNITLHKWKFRRGAELSDVSGMGASYGDDLTTQVDPEEITPDPDDENNGLGLRADVRGHEGGVWGSQQSLRTSSEPSVIAVRGSRKEDHRVHFGYDTPAMGFMGGDMVVRTSVSRGLSISNVFTSSGRNRINMESDAAALSALWQSPSGFYAGGGTRYVRSLSNISTRGFALARDNEGVGVGASAKAGYRLAVPVGRMDFSVAPQVQLLWSSVDFDDFAGLTGEVVSLEDGELVTGRLGLLWDGEWQDASGLGRIYGKMNLHNALDGETVVSVSGVPLSRERSELSADGKLGLSYEWNEGYAVRGEVSASQRDDAEEIRADFAMSIDF